jgi:hypothetical protein
MPGRTDAKDDVHRLRDIVVEEVSLVDRAANKRRFLVVKRSGEMPDGEDHEMEETVDAGGETQSTGDDLAKAKKKPGAGVDSAVDEEKRKKPADDEETQKARRRAADEEADAEKAKEPTDDEGDKKKQRKAKALVLPTPMKDALLAGLTDALERLMAIANSVKEADSAEGDTDASMPDDMSEEMDAISELLSGLCEGAPEAKRKAAVVEKAGARMSRDRLDRFQKALSLLADILKELTDLKIQTGEPTAGAAQKAIKKQDAPAAPSTVPGMAELVGGISELTRVVKRQEEELGRIRQTRGVSNAIQVDGGGGRAEPADVSWPLDMNRPINREQVKKEVSFFDE